MRPRREVSRVTLALLRPFFRWSAARDAFILRIIGNSRGPVLVRKGTASNVMYVSEREVYRSRQKEN